MLVVADASPLIVLVEIERIEILHLLFDQVIIPPQVSAELRQPARTQRVRDFMTAGRSWLVERAPSRVEAIPGLHAGELAAISLAQELKADLLLIDEMRGRKVAAARDIPITGTVGVLELAAEQGLLDLKEAFRQLKATDFWISGELLDDRLRMRGEQSH